ncbi:hypothetical protein SCANM63S_01660 [Streptomyces canarius]
MMTAILAVRQPVVVLTTPFGTLLLVVALGLVAARALPRRASLPAAPVAISLFMLSLPVRNTPWPGQTGVIPVLLVLLFTPLLWCTGRRRAALTTAGTFGRGRPRHHAPGDDDAAAPAGGVPAAGQPGPARGPGRRHGRPLPVPYVAALTRRPRPASAASSSRSRSSSASRTRPTSGYESSRFVVPLTVLGVPVLVPPGRGW